MQKSHKTQFVPVRKVAFGVVALAFAQAELASAATVIASQDFSVKRGPSVELGLHSKEGAGLSSTDRYLMLRFDSTSFGSDVTSATFNITANSDSVVQFQDTFTYRIYGVPDLTANDELVAETGYDPSSGAVYDGSDDLVNAATLTLLGDTTSVSAGDTISFSNPNLLSFLQADTNDVATLVFTRVTNGGDSTFRDRNFVTPPRL